MIWAGINILVSCGGVVVNPGDAILADESGVLVLAADEVNAAVSRALDIQNKGKVREASVKTGLKLGDVSGATQENFRPRGS